MSVKRLVLTASTLLTLTLTLLRSLNCIDVTIGALPIIGLSSVPFRAFFFSCIAGQVRDMVGQLL